MNPFREFKELRFACLKVPVVDAATELDALLNQDAEPKRYTIRWLPGTIDWESFRNSVSGAQPLRAVLWTPSTGPGSSAIMANRSDGLAHTLKAFARIYPHEIFRVSIRDNESDPYPGRTFAHYADRLKVDREVAAMVDSDGWTFVATGERQPYEDAALYQKRRVADRLTRDAISSYLTKLGFGVVVDDFWRPQGEYAVLEQAKLSKP